MFENYNSVKTLPKISEYITKNEFYNIQRSLLNENKRIKS